MTIRVLLRFCGAALVAMALTACSDTPATPGSDFPRPQVLVKGLVGPTQFVEQSDGSLVIAQLNGDEDAATGQIVKADPVTGAIDVLLDQLDKPTGVAVLDGSLWVMERRALVRIPWDGNGAPSGELTAVVDDLPYNGRSSGTLTPLDATTLLYETSGELAGSVDTGRVTAGSGTLFALDTRTLTSRVIATGTKHAYGHWVLSPERVLTTEILDGPGVHPSDELNMVDPSTVTDLGWPRCPADLPTKPGCGAIAPPLAVVPPDSTPTGVAVGEGIAYVALFVPGTIVGVPINSWNPGDPSRPYNTVASDLQGPHSLVIASDGRLLLSEHFTGRILAFRLN